MDYLTKQALHIRYIKLYFTVSFIEDTRLPQNKLSAIRGGIGEMLLRENCIRDRRCEQCDFRDECIVQRTMYTHFKEKPSYVTTGDSVGYVLECEDYQEYFQTGDQLKFAMLLFGKNIVYFSQYVRAVYALGIQGLGKYRARFQLYSVKNSDQENILINNNIYMEKYKIRFLDGYVEEKLNTCETEFRQIVFVTPLTVKYRGEFLHEFRMEAILAGIRRRIYMLDCFEEIQNELWMQCELPYIEIVKQKAFLKHVNRYSSRKNSKMTLRGLIGTIDLKDVREEAKILLLVGELIHVGKNTSFGFGRYRIVN